MRKGSGPQRSCPVYWTKRGLQKRLISHSNLKITRLSNSAVSQEHWRRCERGDLPLSNTWGSAGEPRSSRLPCPTASPCPRPPTGARCRGCWAHWKSKIISTVTLRFLTKIVFHWFQRYVLPFPILTTRSPVPKKVGDPWPRPSSFWHFPTWA